MVSPQIAQLFEENISRERKDEFFEGQQNRHYGGKRKKTTKIVISIDNTEKQRPGRSRVRACVCASVCLCRSASDTVDRRGRLIAGWTSASAAGRGGAPSRNSVDREKPVGGNRLANSRRGKPDGTRGPSERTENAGGNTKIADDCIRFIFFIFV